MPSSTTAGYIRLRTGVRVLGQGPAGEEGQRRITGRQRLRHDRGRVDGKPWRAHAGGLQSHEHERGRGVPARLHRERGGYVLRRARRLPPERRRAGFGARLPDAIAAPAGGWGEGLTSDVTFPGYHSYSHSLGYSELSALGRAFHRWTGSTPLAM